MSNAREWNWALLIPIVLNVLALSMLETSLRQHGLERTIVIFTAALGWPWLLYFVVGRVLESVAERAAKKSREANDRDFV